MVIIINLLEPMGSIAKQCEQIRQDTKNKIQEITDRANKELSELKIAYERLSEMNTACNECEGTGKMWEDDGCGYESRMHRTTCTKCGGTGEHKTKT